MFETTWQDRLVPHSGRLLRRYRPAEARPKPSRVLVSAYPAPLLDASTDRYFGNVRLLGLPPNLAGIPSSPEPPGSWCRERMERRDHQLPSAARRTESSQARPVGL